MADDADEEGRRNWRDARRYESMLALDRRAWAEQCLSRDRDFIAAVASVVPTSSKSLRREAIGPRTWKAGKQQCERRG